MRAGEVRGLLLANVDMGMRRVRVVGKGGRERVVPVDAAFFAELGAYLREERPAGCRTAECFVVLRGPTTGMALTEAGMRSVFRTHRQSSGAVRVRPHRLRHTYVSHLIEDGVDPVFVQRQVGHSWSATTAAYTSVGSDAANRMLRAALDRALVPATAVGGPR